MRIAGLSPNRLLKIVNRFLISLLLGAQQAQIFQQYRIVRPLPESLKPFTLRTRQITSVPINRPEVRTGETATRRGGQRVADKCLLIAPNQILPNCFDDINYSECA